jgi:hypothetical protein
MLLFLGILVVLSAIGHVLAMLARAGALLILAVTTPISAAGLVADAGRAWFWTSLRWFHAAAFTPAVMALTLGLGTKLTTNVAAGVKDHTLAGIGTATIGVLLVCISYISRPMPTTARPEDIVNRTPAVGAALVWPSTKPWKSDVPIIAVTIWRMNSMPTTTAVVRRDMPARLRVAAGVWEVCVVMSVLLRGGG